MSRGSTTLQHKSVKGVLNRSYSTSVQPRSKCVSAVVSAREIVTFVMHNVQRVCTAQSAHFAACYASQELRCLVLSMLMQLTGLVVSMTL